MTARNSPTSSPPAKRAPGLLGNTIGGLMQILGWVMFSLMLSILIEWIGIATLWKEQGSAHAEKSLQSDLSYLNQRLLTHVWNIEYRLRDVVNVAITWVDHQSERLSRSLGHRYHDSSNSSKLVNMAARLNTEADRYTPYFEVVPPVVKSFFVRLALLIFSLPAFALFFMLGMVDGLVERDLRRWGGGRESSMVYNLARKSIFRFFIGACVVYISLPTSVNPTWVILPFAVAFGLSTRVTFERLKKYF